MECARCPSSTPTWPVSERLDPDAVPAVILLAGGAETDRVEGLQRDRLVALFAAAGATIDVAGLPALRSGCASLTRDPAVAGGIAARRARAEGRIRSRVLRIGGLEDPVEALHDRGLTDGLPVVPPTPERVVAMLEHTSRDPQDLVGASPRPPSQPGRRGIRRVRGSRRDCGCSGGRVWWGPRSAPAPALGPALPRESSSSSSRSRSSLRPISKNTRLVASTSPIPISAVAKAPPSTPGTKAAHTRPATTITAAAPNASSRDRRSTAQPEKR